MRTAIGGILTIHEGKMLFTIVVGMREREFDAIALVPADIIKGAVSHLRAKKIKKPFLSLEFFPVERDREP